MRTICRTAYGSKLQTAQYFNLPHVIEENATLNQWVPTINKNGMVAEPTGIQPRLTTGAVTAFSLQSYNPTLDTNDLKAKYLAIGNMGLKNFTPADQNSPPYTGVIPHMARHSGLYGMIPFALCLPGNDLLPVERANYRFRVWVKINNQQYIAYFLRLIAPTNQSVEIKYVTVNNGVKTEQAFTPTQNDLLNPTKPGTPGAPILTTGDYISVTAPIDVILTPVEVQRLIDVADILYNNPDQAIISEMAICHGLDKSCYHSFDGTTINTTTPLPEAIGVQVSSYLSANYPLVYSEKGLEVNLNVGAVEPLYGVS